MSILKHNNKYDAELKKIQGLNFLPYVGGNFGSGNKRILIFGHNYYEKSDKGKENQNREIHRFANAMDELTFKYCKEGCEYPNEKKCTANICWWTKTWKQFITGCVGRNYISELLDKDIKNEKVIKLVKEISFINYINEFIVIENGTNTPKLSKEKIQNHNQINEQIIRILNITHCICWGKDVSNYIKGIDNYEVRKERHLGKKGFYSFEVKEKTSGRIIKFLRVYHPSRPQGFSGYKSSNQATHKIVKDFLSS